MTSLASLFEKISQPNPVEIDPEDAYHSIDAKIKKSKDDATEGPQDIQQSMGPSLLRRKLDLKSSLEAQEDKKYAGRLVSVKDWMDAGGDRNSMHSEDGGMTDENLSSKKNRREKKSARDLLLDDDSDSNPEEETEEEEEDSGEDNESEGDEEFEEEKAQGSSQEEEEEEEEPTARLDEDESVGSGTSDTESSTSTSDTRDHQEPSLKAPNATKTSVHPKTDTAQAQEHPSDLIQQLQVSVKADIEKGKAVKRQLATYDRILALRIGLQKSLVATNKLVGLKPEGEAKQDGLQEDVEEKRRLAIENLLQISSKLGSLRAHFIESVDSDGQPPPKRRKNNLSSLEAETAPINDLAGRLEEAEQLDKRLSPYLRTTIRKWSTKINSTLALNHNNPKKFAPSSRQQQHQNVMDHLDQIWTSKEEREKLIQRSRTIKTLPEHHRSSTSTTATTNDQDKNTSCCRPAIFDDRDFYLSLLKEVVETASRNQDLTEESILNTRDYRSERRHRENVDPKASKGRKIRYDIHEKLVSIMVPIQNELWTDEQKDELFASLFGFGFEPDHHHQQQQPQPQPPQPQNSQELEPHPSSSSPSTADQEDAIDQAAQKSLSQGFKLF